MTGAGGVGCLLLLIGGLYFFYFFVTFVFGVSNKIVEKLGTKNATYSVIGSVTLPFVILILVGYIWDRPLPLLYWVGNSFALFTGILFILDSCRPLYWGSQREKDNRSASAAIGYFIVGAVLLLSIYKVINPY